MPERIKADTKAGGESTNSTFLFHNFFLNIESSAQLGKTDINNLNNLISNYISFIFNTYISFIFISFIFKKVMISII